MLFVNRSFLLFFNLSIFLVINSTAVAQSTDRTTSAKTQLRTNSAVIEKELAHPSPVQWRLNADNRNVAISLTRLAWGPASAPEMKTKRTEPSFNLKGEELPGRSFVIALGFQAKMSDFVLDMRTRSGLVRVKDADGNTEPPWELVPSGFVLNINDIHFAIGDATTQYWDLFPVRPDEKEFLFEVHSPAQTVQYFRVIVKDNELQIINSTPEVQSACLEFTKTFAGSIGSDSLVTLQLRRQHTVLSGIEQYLKLGETLGITGVVDSLGYFTIEERRPKDRVVGILKGNFDTGYRTMSGYFSKPDGSRLQPFEFHEVQSNETGKQLPLEDCQ